MKLLDAALSYAQRGFYVFPCAWIENGACSCRDPECESPGKHPLTPHGLLDATNGFGAVKDFWTKFPKANIAVATGEKSGIVVIDIDDPPTGKAELRKLLPGYNYKGVGIQETGKGYHLVFAYPGSHVKTGNKFLPGIDCRGDGGYIIAAPSNHICGKTYHWKVPLNGSIAPLPAPLLIAVNGHSASSNGTKPRFDNSIVWEGIPAGQRDETLFKYACQIRHANTPRDVAEKIVLEAAARCKPPFAERGALRKVEQAYKYSAGDESIGKSNDDTVNHIEAEAVLSKVADIQPKRLRWLWHSRIPLGKVTVLDGDPGLGKSLLSIEIATCLSNGKPMPNAATADFSEAAGAVFLSAEDDPEDTIRPRLELVGADLNRIILLTAIKRPDGLYMPTIADLGAIRQAIKEIKAKLVVIDPLMAYLPAETNSYRDQDVRRTLAPLAALAGELDVAVLVIRHLNKTSNSNPIYRGGGSIGIIGAARSGLMVAKDPDDDSRFILSVAKSNLAKLPASLAYEILSNAAEVPFINWLGPTSHTAASLLQDQADSAEERSAVKDAEDFLIDYLSDLPRKAGDCFKAARAAGIAERTLKRAKAALNVKTRKSDFEGAWVWELTKGANDTEGSQSEDL